MNSPYESAKRKQAEGDFDAAVELYGAALEADPDDYRSLNNLGVCLEALGRSAEAEGAYRRALEVRSDLAPIHYNLGHLFHAGGSIEQAIPCYKAALEADADYAAARYNLGTAFLELDRLVEAEAEYSLLLKAEAPPDHPEFFKVPGNLGQVLADQGRLEDAEAAYRQAVSMQPESAKVYVDLGRCLLSQDRTEAAREAFEQALALDPLNRDARKGLADFHQRAAKPEEAAAVYAELLKLAPEDPIAQHMLAAWGGADTPARASDEFVEATFDSFADSFDRVLKRLKYRAPSVLAEAVAKNLKPAGLLDALDAGCGTGLCQSWLRPYADRLVGVDLSEKMLAKARQRGGYDALVKAELTAYFAENPAGYDLIVSADTLIYFGELERVLAGAARSLKSDGLLAFTLERLDDAEAETGYRLNSHGRYSHTREYLERVLAAAGLELRMLGIEVLRLEQGRSVDGWVVVAARGTTDG